MNKTEIKLMILEELDDMLSGCEKAIYQNDDPSGIFTEYVLDTDAFRRNLDNRIMELQTELVKRVNDDQ